jgi:penicillin-binding protein 1C
VLAFWASVWIVTFPRERLDKRQVASLSFRDANGTLLRQEMSSGGIRETWVPLDEISPHLLHATLASEDNLFFDHAGVDWLAMLRATWLNLKGLKLAYGGSTISMQLVRLTAGTQRTLFGKLHQMILTKNLESEISKNEILEQYLNRVYYGNGAWGAEQAARFYFDKSAGELSVGEAALLAVMPRGPSRYDPFRHWSRVMKRRDQILKLMAKHQYIDQKTHALAKRTPIALASREADFLAPHFVQFVKTRLPGGFDKAATVNTTLDLPLQQSMERALRTHVDKLTWRHLTQAALVVIRNDDGAVLAMVGSRNYFDADKKGAYNGVTARLRPGSTLKPFVYGAAMEQGDTPATIAFDVVLPEDRHQFYSKDVRSHGFARYRESLAGSYNLSAVHTLQRVGKGALLEKLRDAGITTLDRPDDDYDWGLAIGHAEVRLLELTQAFSTFGRGGRPIVPRAIDEIIATDGRKWQAPEQEGKRVFSEEIAYLIFDILSDPDARRPMFGTSVPMNLPFKVALKTGTTKAYTDLWAVGTTREYTVGVWAGNFDGDPTHQVRSVHGATPLMRAAYTAIAARFGHPTAPSRPSGIVRAPICPLSGKAPGPHCEHRKHELFIEGHIPTETCDWHREACGEVGVVYPKEIRGWAAAMGARVNNTCQEVTNSGPVRIVEPAEGAVFVLEPHRPAQYQRPPLKVLPHGTAVSWKIDGEPAKSWIPVPGPHRVEVTDGRTADAVSIVYEK